MPPSKQVRSRQNRQKERIAIAHREQARARKRRRIIGGILAVVIGGAAIAGAAAIIQNNNDTVAITAPPTTVAGTVQPCVKMKGTLPKGAPSVPVQVGPPPKTLVIKDLKVGTGPAVKPNSKVEMNYIGVACSTGEIFDSSYSRNKTFQADLSGGVIPGWQKGVPGMKIGGLRLLGIPPDQAYGANGQGSIGPNETLWFVVEAVKVD